MTNFEKIQAMLSEELGVKPEKIEPDTNLKDLGSDSIALMAIIDNIQEEYDIDVPDDAIKNVQTVRDIVEYLDANA
ncbi:MAG: acyl carrier protein [Clostridia bacterium]|nr:acyl carrier protein [Clostridia bacterium]